MRPLSAAGKIHVPRELRARELCRQQRQHHQFHRERISAPCGRTPRQRRHRDGPIDAVFKAIDKITKTGYSLDDYSIRAVTAGEDALGEATVRLKKDGKTFTGRGVSMDIIESSVHAYISAINKVVAEEGLTCERE